MTVTTGALALGLVFASPATATVTRSVAGTEVTLSSDGADDTIQVVCDGGATEDSGVNIGILCTNVTDLVVTAGGGTDNLDLDAMTAAQFSNLPSVTINASGDGGGATISGSQLRDIVSADNQDAVTTNGGNDTVVGGSGVETGTGDDNIFGASNTDGGPGDDTFVNPLSAPHVGGAGFDVIRLDSDMPTPLPAGAEATLTFTNTGLSQQITGQPSQPPVVVNGMERWEIEIPNEEGGTLSYVSTAYTGQMDIVGGSGANRMTTGPGNDDLQGRGGADTLNPGGGTDVVYAGAGNDIVNSRDGRADRVDCGNGVDTLTADHADTIVGCETVRLPAPNTGKISGPAKVRQGQKARFTFSSSVAGSRFECKLDKGPYRTCRSPFTVKTNKLKPGKHTLSVRAAKPAGNRDASPSVKRFKVTKARRR